MNTRTTPATNRTEQYWTRLFLAGISPRDFTFREYLIIVNSCRQAASKVVWDQSYDVPLSSGPPWRRSWN